MGSPTKLNDRDLNHILALLKEGNETAFESLYNHFSKQLFYFIYSRIKMKEATEEILQEIFVSLWNNRETLQINTSLDAYLHGAAKNKILSFIRAEQVRKKYAAELTQFAYEHSDNSIEEQMDVNDLQLSLQEKIAELPDKCQVAFRMSRLEHTPNSQIAEKMNISTRTVENYISQALRHLRTNLGALAALAIAGLSIALLF